MPLVKSIWVKMSASGAAETKREIDDVAARADELSKADHEIKMSVDDRAAKLKLDGLRLRLRALEMSGADKAAFRDLAGQLRGIGTEADGARLKTAALGLELRAIRDATKGDGGTSGGWWAKLLAGLGSKAVLGSLGGKLGGLLGGTTQAGAEGAAGGAAGAGAGGTAAAGGFLGPIGALGIGASAITLLSTGIGGIIPLLAAATMGLGAFAALALPTFTSLTAGITGVTAATTNYQNASAALDVAIHKSPADLAAYRAVLVGLEPDLAKAATLLTNQNVTWQGLSPAMRKNVVALSDNSAALKTLLPDQKKALDALLAERTAWDGLTPAQQRAATGYQKLSTAYQNAQAKLAPVALQLATIGLSIANKILPSLVPFARVAGGILLNLATGFDKFASSPGFKAFMAEMLKLSGPAINAVGQGIGRVVIAVGKLLEALVSPNGLFMLKGVFNVIEWVVQGLAAVIRNVVPPVVHSLGDIRQAAIDVGHWAVDAYRLWMDAWHGTVDVVSAAAGGIVRVIVSIPRAGAVLLTWFAALPGRVGGFLASLPGILYHAGAAAMQGLLSGLESELPAILSFAAGIASKIASLKGPIEKDRVLLVPAGVAIMDGLYQGMHKGRPRILSLAAEIGIQISDKLMDAFMSRRDKVSDAAGATIAGMIRARIGEIRAFVVGIAGQMTSWASLTSAAQGPAFSNPRWIPGHAAVPGSPGSIIFSHLGGPVVTGPSGGHPATHGHWAGGVAPPTGRQLLRNLRLDLGRLKAFGHVLGRLRHMGLDQALLSQLIAAGPDQGYQIAEAILDAGRGEIRQLDRTENQIWQTGVGIGKTAAKSHFGSGVSVILNFNGFIAGNPREIAREIQKLLRELKRANGGAALGLT